MAKPSKKQSLLGQVQSNQKKRTSTTKNRRPSPQQIAAMKAQQTAQAQQAQTATDNDRPKGKGKWITLAVIGILFVVLPKPQLITYEKLGLVASSVYWPGLPGIDPVLFDSNLHPKPALERNTLYLCHDLKNPDTCQKYQIIKQEGFIAAMMELISG
ncbi:MULTISPECIES: hypothetical protein [Pseudoalteromonas]|uniref:Uncharacterized protein n=1 Tax=Pseudoalteromonas maricaloris TaxID=184924 RepID=A0A8I2KKU2_9GAMM|nr:MULTISPECIES: hypothetical protein [Pseudoalteromonas]KID32873.1 hypothetical protein QT15_20665 [Pseudoalteromonas flavipulchra NCIMB 2033 = ATCC BAA-314]MBD0781026.1 hypothetical protein [Pseudoalteromonas flavipulchra]MBE0373623.1 hypothetical protein [Pseudoalteromonas flavipulchra NCIMB 2033 = ATCC BAA-314]NLR19881.1 hypothetical protein [Pseudoalteromonas maricaloris]RZG16622.1 hypothetical protein EXT47_04635 [Pseudoalteromonas sp. CO342X]